MRPRDEIKEKAIRQKAIEMIVEKGFDGLSMQKLAQAAGVSPATIYIYYKDREDLINQLSISASMHMAEATLEGFDPTMSFAEGLKIQWLNRAKYWMKNPTEAQFLEQIRHSPYQCNIYPLMKKDFSEKMRSFVMGAIKRGEIVKLPVEVYWSIAFAPLYNLIKFHMAGKSMANDKFSLTEEMILQTLEIVLKGLKP